MLLLLGAHETQILAMFSSMDITVLNDNNKWVATFW
jgi:hypothetical protein